MRKSKAAPPFVPTSKMLSIYSGQQVVGFLLPRGRAGIELFNADGTSLGLFATQNAAAAALYQQGATDGQA
jgi:hypothetical protein